MSEKVMLRMTARVESASSSRNAAERPAPARAMRVLARRGIMGADAPGCGAAPARRAAAASPEPVSHAPHRLDPRGLLRRVDLAAHARDQDVHGVGHRLLAFAPGVP